MKTKFIDKVEQQLEDEIQCNDGLLSYLNSLEPTVVKEPSIQDWNELLQRLEDDRKEEYQRVSKMEKEAKKSIKKICKDHNCKFEDLPLELQSVLQYNIMGITPMFGKWWFDNFKEKYPEFAYLI